MDNEKDVVANVTVNEELTGEDEDLEYDSEGNLLIPDDSDETEDSEVQEEPDEDKETKKTESDLDGSDKTPEEANEEVPSENDGKDSEQEPLRMRVGELERENAKRESELEKLKAQVKDTLSKLGVKNDDPIGGLIEVAAEACNQSPEEYLKQLKKEERTKKAIELLDQTEMEKKINEDFQILKNSFPELRECKTIMDIPNVKEFARFRDLGLNAVQAYSAANHDEIRKNVVASVKRQNLNDTKEHLRSSATKSTKNTKDYIPNSELQLLRSAFPDKSDKEISELYRKVKK